MTFLISEPQITLYKDDFDSKYWENDIFNRKADGERLWQIVDSIDQPATIAVNGAWGAGKTVFLKLWAGQYSKPIPNSDENKESNVPPEIIYLDAFEYDFLGNALSVLMIHLLEKFKDFSEEGKSSAVTTAIANLKKFGRPLLRVGLNVGSAAFTGLPIAGEIVDAGIEGVANEAAEATKRSKVEAERYWDEALGVKQCFEKFRTTLAELAQERPIIFIIDELDRCRPDFALDMLEIAKHLFRVEGVKFILGTNLSELENSARARYGERINATQYLQKFYDLEFFIPAPTQEQARRYALVLPIKNSVADLRLENYERLVEDLKTSIRDINKIWEVWLINVANEQLRETAGRILIDLAFIRVLNRDLYDRLGAGDAELEEVFEFLKLSKYQNTEEEDRNSTHDIASGQMMAWITLFNSNPDSQLLSEMKRFKTEPKNYIALIIEQMNKFRLSS